MVGKTTSLTDGWSKPCLSSHCNRSILGCEYGLPGFLGVNRWARCRGSMCLMVLSIHPKHNASSIQALLSEQTVDQG